MPTSEEQVVQVEAALRGRFFPLIQKVTTLDRNGWQEDQHDTDRLSRALAAYVLVGLCDIDDATAVSSVTDGKNDGGIDALYFDRPGSRLLIVQSKFKRNGAAPSQDDVLKTINGIRALLDRRFDGFNVTLQQRLDEIEEVLDTPGVTIEVALVFLGENLARHATDDLNRFQSELNTLNPRFSWTHHGLSRIYGWLTAEQSPVQVTVDIPLDNWACTTVPRKAVYGQISAVTLACLVKTHGKALFERNIRHYLGSVGVNTAITETVRLSAGDFFYLNNGLTAVAETITQAPGGNRARCNFRLLNVSIVNGAQTAGAIATAAAIGGVSHDAKILITVIEIGTNPDDIAFRITRARNHQNVVRGVDFAALDPAQEHLRQELAIAGITYHYRPSAEARVRRDDAFTLEEATLALACLSFRVMTSDHVLEIKRRKQRPQNAVDFVVTAKKEIGRLWDQGGTIYGDLFGTRLSGMRMWRLVQAYRFMDLALAATERSETGYYRRMFFRHGRYFIMAFVAHLIPEVLQKSELYLSEADKTALSLRTNEVAELIYAESVPLQGSRGYLAIFRNLTDSQPLADGILRRLSEARRSVAVGDLELAE